MKNLDSTSGDLTVLGANGFIGRTIVNAAVEVEGLIVRGMTRSVGSATRHSGVHWYRGDLGNYQSIREAIRGSRFVIHAASYIGYDPEQCYNTKVLGTNNVIEACRAEAVERLVYVSTASVYGSGPHAGPREDEVAIAPQSTLSHSRAAAEELVLTAGGISLRPNMIFGAGDRWFIPGARKFRTSLGALVDEGRSQISIIHVEDFADAALGVCLSETSFIPGPLHVAYHLPTSMREVLSAVSSVLGEVEEPLSIHRSQAVDLAIDQGYTQRQFDLLTLNHWYNVSRLATTLGRNLDGKFALRPKDVSWYRSLLQ